MSSRKVLVTGATGLVGFHVVQHQLQKGDQVVALVRRTSSLDGLKSLRAPGDLKIAIAELGAPQALKEAMAGVDVVVHAAGTVDPLGNRQDIFSVNVGGTRSVLAEAEKAGVKQFIHVSSLSVITGQNDQFDVDESAPLRTCGEAYADSKVAAEQLVMSFASQSLIKVTVVRPGFIYGAGEKAWMPRLINSLRTGKAMLIDGGHKETNVIFVGNLCLAIELAMLNPVAYGQVYNLTDGQHVTKKQLFDAICDGLDVPRVTRTIPGVIARIACELVSTVAPALPHEVQRRLSRYSRAAFRLAGVNQGFSIGKAERELKYINRLPFEEAMRSTLASFKAGAGRSGERSYTGACN